MLGILPDRSGANASGSVIGIPGEHFFSESQNRAGEQGAALRGISDPMLCENRRFPQYALG